MIKWKKGRLFCDSGWESIHGFVKALSNGGFRPVSFYIETEVPRQP